MKIIEIEIGDKGLLVKWNLVVLEGLSFWSYVQLWGPEYLHCTKCCFKVD